MADDDRTAEAEEVEWRELQLRERAEEHALELLEIAECHAERPCICDADRKAYGRPGPCSRCRAVTLVRRVRERPVAKCAAAYPRLVASLKAVLLCAEAFDKESSAAIDGADALLRELGELP